VTDFDQISECDDVQRALKELYGSVDRIEFFAGLFAEDVRPNSALPGLIGRMVGVDAFSQALTNPLLSTNVFNPSTFSNKGWEIIHESRSLSQILHRNLGGETGTLNIKMTQNGEEVPPPTAMGPVVRAAAARGPAVHTESVAFEAAAESATMPAEAERSLFVK
jgi:Animal haem peroxidase